MTVIFKYKVPFPFGVIEMPKGAQVLTVEWQRDAACIWAEVDRGAPLISRAFVVLGTGQEIPPQCRYVGTWQEGPFVWHLYENNQVSV